MKNNPLSAFKGRCHETKHCHETEHTTVLLTDRSAVVVSGLYIKKPKPVFALFAFVIFNLPTTRTSIRTMYYVLVCDVGRNKMTKANKGKTGFALFNDQANLTKSTYYVRLFLGTPRSCPRDNRRKSSSTAWKRWWRAP